MDIYATFLIYASCMLFNILVSDILLIICFDAYLNNFPVA